MRIVNNKELRRNMLFGLLACSILISAFTFFTQDENPVVEAISIARTPTQKKEQELASIISGQSYASRSFYTPSIDIFSGIQPPATQEPKATNQAVQFEDRTIKTIDLQEPVVVSPPPPAPTPTPFKFIGKLYGDDEYIVFLNYNGRNIAVKTGEVLFEKYKVEEIKPPTMTLVNLPLSSKETISIGEP